MVVGCILGGMLGYSILPTIVLRVKAWNRKGEKCCSNPPSKPRKKEVYLTFDDGPDVRYTNELLDVLSKHRVVATFFVVVEFAKEHPEVLRRMLEEGHEIELHCLEHTNALWQTPKETYQSLTTAIRYLEEQAIQVKWYRPPWGCVNLMTLYVVKKYGWKLVFWDVMVGDWRRDTTSKRIYRKLMRQVGPSSVICLHDGRGRRQAPSRMIRALDKALQEWKEKDFAFSTLCSTIKQESKG